MAVKADLGQSAVSLAAETAALAAKMELYTAVRESVRAGEKNIAAIPGELADHMARIGYNMNALAERLLDESDPGLPSFEKDAQKRSEVVSRRFVRGNPELSARLDVMGCDLRAYWGYVRRSGREGYSLTPEDLKLFSNAALLAREAVATVFSIKESKLLAGAAIAST